MHSDITRRHLDFHDTTSAMTAMEVDYPHGASTGWHSHPRAQLLYAIEGVMIVRSTAGSWVVPSNRAAWLVAGVEHDVRMCGAVKIRTLFIDSTIAPHLPASCVMEVSPLLRELVIAAMQVPIDYQTDSRDGRLMRLLLDELRICDQLPLHLPLPQDPRLRSICEAFIENPEITQTAEQWAEQLGITAKTIHRLFGQQTGMTFADWRQTARLLAALQKITSGKRLVDVALECGYASQSAFTAMFKRHFGMPPSEFYR
ncbi:MAG: helix-turn-helix transcriptional regulator [Steroidobacteraceae bacterium]